MTYTALAPSYTQRPVPNESSKLGTPNCPIIALRYYHRFMNANPSCIRKDIGCSSKSRITALARSLLLPPFLGGSAIKFKFKSHPKIAKAQEVHAVTTSLHLFSKVDLQIVMKASTWSGAVVTVTSAS